MLKIEVDFVESGVDGVEGGTVRRWLRSRTKEKSGPAALVFAQHVARVFVADVLDEQGRETVDYIDAARRHSA